jgi:hypothetical protein
LKSVHSQPQDEVVVQPIETVAFASQVIREVPADFVSRHVRPLWLVHADRQRVVSDDDLPDLAQRDLIDFCP